MLIITARVACLCHGVTIAGGCISGGCLVPVRGRGVAGLVQVQARVPRSTTSIVLTSSQLLMMLCIKNHGNVIK